MQAQIGNGWFCLSCESGTKTEIRHIPLEMWGKLRRHRCTIRSKPHACPQQVLMRMILRILRNQHSKCRHACLRVDDASAHTHGDLNLDPNADARAFWHSLCCVAAICLRYGQPSTHSVWKARKSKMSQTSCPVVVSMLHAHGSLLTKPC